MESIRKFFLLTKANIFLDLYQMVAVQKILSISLNGDTFYFSEDYNLIGIPHQAGISEYFTWEYEGQKNIQVSEMQDVSITVNPNGKTLGSVSVYIIEN